MLYFNLHPEITISKGTFNPEPTARDLEESWVLVHDTAEARAFQAAHRELQRRPSIFNDWPSFGVYDKMSGTQ